MTELRKARLGETPVGVAAANHENLPGRASLSAVESEPRAVPVGGSVRRVRLRRAGPRRPSGLTALESLPQRKRGLFHRAVIWMAKHPIENPRMPW